MKTVASLSLFVFLALAALSLWPTAAQQGGQTKAGTITGIVIQEVQKDGDTSVKMKIESSTVPFDSVAVPAFNKEMQIKDWHLPNDWKMTLGEKGTVITGPPTNRFLARFDVPKTAAINKVLEKALAVRLSIGGFEVASQTLEVKKVDPPQKPPSLNDVAHVPEAVRAGNTFSATLKEGHRDGELKLESEAKIKEEKIIKEIIARKTFTDQEREVAEKFIVDVGSNLYQGLPVTEKELELKNELIKLGFREFTFSSHAEEVNVTAEMSSTLIGTLVESRQIEQLPLNIRGLQILALAAIAPGVNYTPTTTFFIPPETKKVTLTYFEFGQPVASGSLNVLPSLPVAKEPPAPRLINCTPKVFVNNTVCVCGYFPDEFTRLTLLVNGEPVGRPLSGSTDMVTIPAGDKIGRRVITWNTTAFDVVNAIGGGGVSPSPTEKVEFEVLDAKGSIDSSLLAKKQTTKLQIEVLGTEEKLPIRLVNNSPSIIEMKGGDRLMTTGGKPNVLEREVTGLQAGGFNIYYELNVGPCPCNPEGVKGAASGTVTGQTADPPKGNPPSAPKDQERQRCQAISAECDIAEARLRSERARYEEGKEACRKSLSEPGGTSSVKNCLEGMDRAYIPVISNLETLLRDCKNRSPECSKFDFRFRDSFAMTTPSRPETKPEEVKPCDEIEAECEGLKALVERLRKQRDQAFQACNRIQTDERRRESCRVGADKLLSPRIVELEIKESECRKRYAACVAGRP